MVYKILLSCALGFSTSMLVSKIEQAAQQENIKVLIQAIARHDIEQTADDADILLLGPQVGHLKDTYEKNIDIPVAVISPQDYGMMNGKKVLEEAIKIIQASHNPGKEVIS